VFILERPYTDKSELAGQMTQVAEKLCKKIHERTGIHTIQQKGGKRFIVLEPRSKFKKYLDYGGRGSKGGLHTVKGRII